MARLMLTTLSAMTPRPTQRSIPTGALVSAAIEAVSPFDDADASLTSGAPFLAVAESALFLLALAFSAFGRAVGNANALDTLRLCGGFIPGGIECGVRYYQTWRASQQGLMVRTSRQASCAGRNSPRAQACGFVDNAKRRCPQAHRPNNSRI